MCVCECKRVQSKNLSLLRLTSAHNIWIVVEDTSAAAEEGAEGENFPRQPNGQTTKNNRCTAGEANHRPRFRRREETGQARGPSAGWRNESGRHHPEGSELRNESPLQTIGKEEEQLLHHRKCNGQEAKAPPQVALRNVVLMQVDPDQSHGHLPQRWPEKRPEWSTTPRGRFDKQTALFRATKYLTKELFLQNFPLRMFPKNLKKDRIKIISPQS